MNSSSPFRPFTPAQAALRTENQKKLKKKVKHQIIAKLYQYRSFGSLSWDLLSLNPAREALELLKENPNKINWEFLSQNTAPEAIDMLKSNPHKINWPYLSGNKAHGSLELFSSRYPAFLADIDPRQPAQWTEEREAKIHLKDALLELLAQAWRYYGSINDEAMTDCEKKFGLTRAQVIETVALVPDPFIPPDAANWRQQNENGWDPNEIDWDFLSRNTAPEAIELLAKNLDRINWCELSANPEAIQLILARMDRDKMDDDVDLLAHALGDLHLDAGATHRAPPPPAIAPRDREGPYVMKASGYTGRGNPDEINWDYLSKNTSREALELLKENPNKISWFNLSANPAPEALKLLLANQENINWLQFSENESPRAIELLRANPDEIDWINLSMNPAPRAIELLAANPDKISWHNLSENPNLFKVIELIELIEQNKHLAQRQRFAFSKLLLSHSPSHNKFSLEDVLKIFDDKPKPTPCVMRSQFLNKQTPALTVDDLGHETVLIAVYKSITWGELVDRNGVSYYFNVASGGGSNKPYSKLRAQANPFRNTTIEHGQEVFEDRFTYRRWAWALPLGARVGPSKLENVSRIAQRVFANGGITLARNRTDTGTPHLAEDHAEYRPPTPMTQSTSELVVQLGIRFGEEVIRSIVEELLLP